MYEVFGSRTMRTFRVLWMMEELGVAYRHIDAPPHSEELRALSPLGKVPVLRDGAAVIPDSVAIMTYLADKHSALTAPAGTVARGHQDAMTFRILDEVEALLWTASRHKFVLPEERRVPQIIPALSWEYARNLERLSGAFSGPFLMGEAMSIPDILLVHCMGWAHALQFASPPEVFKSYSKTLRSRTAYLKAKGD